jgi:hypothetical protein
VRVRNALIPAGLLLVLALAGPAAAGGPTMRIEAAEDFVKQPTLVEAKAKMTLTSLAGFDSVRITAIWAPGETRLSTTEATQFRNVAAAARLAGIKVVVAVYHAGSRTTPLTDEARDQFAQFTASIARANPTFRDFIVGNEPNINRFWLPQFADDGANVAAPAYLALLAKTYDALKGVSPQVVVIGGALSPRGGDNHRLARHTHSPTKFIRDLGAAYRASGRTLPIMDQFAIHPYGDNSSQSPRDSAHPRSTTIGLADYGKLVGLLGDAFDGTPQRGSSLPILYAEYGVESIIPPAKASHYTGTEPATTRPVDEATQGAYYRQAIEMAFCQPNVVGLLVFHVADEPGLPQWQSGVLYHDNTPKASMAILKKAASDARRGVIARCPGLTLTPRAAKVVWPQGSGLRARGPLHFRVACSLDCSYRADLVPARGGKPVLTTEGRIVAGPLVRIGLPARPVRPGDYRLRLTLRAPVNPGPPGVSLSPVLALR